MRGVNRPFVKILVAQHSVGDGIERGEVRYLQVDDLRDVFRHASLTRGALLRDNRYRLGDEIIPPET